MSTKLLSIYQSVLAYAGLSADAGGFISVANGGKPEPAFIDGKRMVLPTIEQLRSTDISTKEVFHPLYETPWKAETAVQKKFLQAVNLKINAAIATVAIALLRLAASPAQHGTMTPEQSQFLYEIKAVDEKTVAEFTAAMNAQLKAGGAERTFVNLYIRRGGTKAGKKYARLGVVVWLFYEKITKPEADFKALKISEKRAAAVQKVLEFMFPGIAESEAYSYGTDCSVAPYFKSLMFTAAMITARLNELLKLYEPYITDAQSLMFDETCLEGLQDLSRLTNDIQMVPPQDDTPAETPVQKQAPRPVADVPPWEVARQSPPTGYPTQPVAPPVQQPAAQSKAPMDLRAFNNAIGGNHGMMPPQQNWGWGQPPQNNWGGPPPGWNNVGMSAPAPGGWGDSWQPPGNGWGQPNTGWGAPQQNWGQQNPGDPMVRTMNGYMPRSQALARGIGYTM